MFYLLSAYVYMFTILVAPGVCKQGHDSFSNFSFTPGYAKLA